MEPASLPSIHLETTPTQTLPLLAGGDHDHRYFWSCAQSLGHFHSRNPAATVKGNHGSFEVSMNWTSLRSRLVSARGLSIVPSESGLVDAALSVSVSICGPGSTLSKDKSSSLAKIFLNL